MLLNGIVPTKGEIMSTVLAKYQTLQKKAFELALEAEDRKYRYDKVQDKMDILWIQLSTKEAEEARLYARELLIGTFG